MPRKTKEDAAATKQCLLDAALVLFDQQGPEKTSVNAVAEKAKVTHGAFYWHFKNRNELVSSLYENKAFLLDELFFEHLQFSHQDGLLALQEYTKAWVAFILEDAERFLVWRLFYCPGAPLVSHPSLAKRLADDHSLWLERLVKLIKKAKKQKLVEGRFAKSPLKLAYVILSLVNGILAQQISIREDGLLGSEAADVWQQQLNIFFHGLAKHS